MTSLPCIMRVLIVDDEAPARNRLRDLLSDIATISPTCIVGFASNGVEALRLLERTPADLVLADIRMPVMDGVELARHLRRLDSPPAVVFTTAYDEYAIQAFELAAADYLLKPVRAERLVEALGKACRLMALSDTALATLAPGARRHFSVTERGRILLVPVEKVIYLKAEQKYITARTADREYLLDESLAHLEQEFGDRFIRIHRNSLVARAALQGVERASGSDQAGTREGHWLALLAGVPERLPVSRRQWPAVRRVLGL